MRTLRSAVLTGLLLGAAASAASAGTFLQEGTPQAPAAVETYGMQASIPVALHTVVPKGWTVIVAPNLALPGRVSWAPTDTWIEVVSRMAQHTAAGFIVDWNDQKLLVRSVSGAMQFVTKYSEINRAATEALPAYAVETTKASTLTAATRSPSAVTKAPAAAAPIPEPSARAGSDVKPQPAPVVAAAPVLSSSPVQSFASKSVEQTLQALATHYGLRLEWHGPDFPLPGPVTFLFSSLREDIGLLDRALGPVAALSVTQYRDSRELVVRRALYDTYAVWGSRPMPVVHKDLWARVGTLFHHEPRASHSTRRAELLASESAGAPERPATSVVPSKATPKAPCKAKSDEAGSTAEQAAAPTQPQLAPESPMLVLDIAVGDRLSTDLDEFLRAHGWSLSWQVPNDLKADDAGHVAGKSVRAVLSELLPLLGLTAQFNSATHVVAVGLAASAAAPPAP